MPTAADKRQDFLWIVQTFMLRDTDVTGWHGFVGDAVAASYRIPDHVTARDAALDFWGFLNQRFGGEERKCPTWLTALSDPNY